MLEAGPHAASCHSQLLIQLTCVNGSFDQFQGGYQLRGACNLNCKLASGQFQHPGSVADGHSCLAVFSCEHPALSHAWVLQLGGARLFLGPALWGT